MTIEPLPDIIRCSQPGCGRTHVIDRDATCALKSGWVMIAGRWLCPDDRAGGGRLDGVDQGEPEPAEEAVLVDQEDP